MIYIEADGLIYFKAIRMIRPVRLIYAFPTLKKSMDSLVNSIPELKKSFFSLFIIMIFYAILGLHLFMGAMEYRCRITDKPDS
jgi:hypothetical protein